MKFSCSSRSSRVKVLSLGVFVVLLHFSITGTAIAAGNDSLKKSLVKIFTTMQNPNYYEPWRIDSQISVSGSGCILPGHRILTNAHVVSNQIFIQVLKEGDTKKYTAKREFVAHDCDLAVLSVDDPAFFKGTKPVTFGGLPYLKDSVQVYGYPVGGENLSITEGVVSRIEIVPYAHSMRNLLAVQTDAAINPGNSGGPVFMKKKMVGVAFQGYNAIVAQNTGFLIPVPIIKRFLKEIKAGAYHSVPSLGLFWENLENDDLRAYLGMKSDQTGILVPKIVWQSSAWNVLQPNDVLLSIDGYPVGNDGTIPFRKGERVHFRYPLCLHGLGDSIPLKILRQGQVQTLKITLKEDVRLVPDIEYDVAPTYFIFDGLVFTPLTMNYLRSVKDPAPDFLVLLNQTPTEDRKQVVLLSHILNHEINKGYGHDYTNVVVRKVNGIPITEMKDLLAAFEKPVGGRHIVEVESPENVIDHIILDANKSKKASDEILKLNEIPEDRSADLKGASH